MKRMSLILFKDIKSISGKEMEMRKRGQGFFRISISRKSSILFSRTEYNCIKQESAIGIFSG